MTRQSRMETLYEINTFGIIVLFVIHVLDKEYKYFAIQIYMIFIEHN